MFYIGVVILGKLEIYDKLEILGKLEIFPICPIISNLPKLKISNLPKISNLHILTHRKFGQFDSKVKKLKLRNAFSKYCSILNLTGIH